MWKKYNHTNVLKPTSIKFSATSDHPNYLDLDIHVRWLNVEYQRRNVAATICQRVACVEMFANVGRTSGGQG